VKIKLSLYYFVFFLAAGTYFPFLSLYLKSEGFSGSEIGLIMAAGSVVGIFTNPILGMVSDASKDYRSLIKLSIVLSALCINGFLLSDYLLPVLLTQIVVAVLSAPMVPIVDAIALEQAPNHGYTYGQVRLWGAAGWTVMTFIAGLIFETIGFKYIFPAYSLFLMGLLVIVFTFPQLERPKLSNRNIKDGIKVLMTSRAFVWFVILSMFNVSLIAMNMTYMPIYYEQLGYPMSFVGWSFGMAALIEVPLFILVAKWIRRHGLIPFMIIGVFTYALKYFLMGFAPPAWLFIGLQLLDGIAFVFTVSAAMEIVNLLAPVNLKATAQTLFGSIAGIAGVAGIIGSLVGGFIIDQQGPQFLFWLMGGVGFIISILFMLFPNKKTYRIYAE
jgi:MFS family permease